MKVTKELNGTKLVENGNIKGILLGHKGNQSVVDVYVKREGLGSYVFVEDIKEGIAQVELVGRKNNLHLVSYKGIIGTCDEQNVHKIMKGTIYDIKDDTFKFRTGKRKEKEEDSLKKKHKEENSPKNEADLKNASEGTTAKDRDTERRDIKDASKQRETTSVEQPESQIENDENKAIELIKSQISLNKEVFPLFNKYLLLLNKKDNFCLFYTNYLIERGMADFSEIKRLIKMTTETFTKKLIEITDDIDVLNYIYKRKKTKKCFIKLLNNDTVKSEENEINVDKNNSNTSKNLKRKMKRLTKEKEELINGNREFLDYSIKYIYNNIKKTKTDCRKLMASRAMKLVLR